MRKYVLLICMLITMLLWIGNPVFAEEKSTSESELNLAPNAKSAILIERDTGKMLFEKNSDEKLPPASMTKVMTLLLIMEALDQGKIKMDEKIRVSEQASSMGGSQVFLEAGEEMTVKDLIKAISIASGNDASVAMAERIAGSEEAFVKQMNDKVKKLGLKNTQFQNSTGLPAKEHYTTAYDMAIMAKSLLKYESITKFTSIYEDYLRKGSENEFWLVNTNKLVRFYPGVDGLKTGFTNEAKYCLTATAKKNDMRVITVIMVAKTPKERNVQVSNMLDYAFNHYETNKLFDKGHVVKELKPLKANENIIPVVVSESVSTIHKKGESKDNIKTTIQIDNSFSFPMKKGDQIGMLHVLDGNKTLSKIPLVVETDVNPATFATLFKRTIGKMVKYR